MDAAEREREGNRGRHHCRLWFLAGQGNLATACWIVLALQCTKRIHPGASGGLTGNQLHPLQPPPFMVPLPFGLPAERGAGAVSGFESCVLAQSCSQRETAFATLEDARSAPAQSARSPFSGCIPPSLLPSPAQEELIPPRGAGVFSHLGKNGFSFGEPLPWSSAPNLPSCWQRKCLLPGQQRCQPVKPPLGLSAPVNQRAPQDDLSLRFLPFPQPLGGFEEFWKSWTLGEGEGLRNLHHLHANRGGGQIGFPSSSDTTTTPEPRGRAGPVVRFPLYCSV